MSNPFFKLTNSNNINGLVLVLKYQQFENLN